MDIKILIVAFEFPPQSGGIGTYAYQVAKYLSRAGNKVTVLALSRYVPDEAIAQFDSGQEFPIIRFSRFKNYLRRVIHRSYLTWKVVHNGDYDVLLIPSPNAGILGCILSKIYHIPYVLTGHGSEFLTRDYLYKKTLGFVYRRASLIFSDSSYTTELIRQCGIDNESILTIPLGADDDIYDYRKYDCKQLREEYDVIERNIILTVGRLTARKGHRVVIDAVGRLKGEFPDILYLIVGTGEEKDRLRTYIDHEGLGNYVRLMGYVPTEKLAEYYALCDVFILNSTIGDDGTTEGFGIVLIEAGLMGKPVIGTTGCGIENAIEHQKSGLLIPRDNVEETENALRTILSDPGLALKMGEYAYRRAKSHYTWESVVTTKEKEIRKLIAKQEG